MPGSSPDLEHDRAIAEVDGLPGAGQDLLVRHAVAVQAAIVRPQAAIGAEPHAIVRQFDQAAEMDLAADEALPRLIGPLPEVGQPPGLVFRGARRRFRRIPSE